MSCSVLSTHLPVSFSALLQACDSLYIHSHPLEREASLRPRVALAHVFINIDKAV